MRITLPFSTSPSTRVPSFVALRNKKYRGLSTSWLDKTEQRCGFFHNTGHASAGFNSRRGCSAPTFAYFPLFSPLTILDCAYIHSNLKTCKIKQPHERLGVKTSDNGADTRVKVSCFPSRNSSLLWPSAIRISYRQRISDTTRRISIMASRFPTHPYGPLFSSAAIFLFASSYMWDPIPVLNGMKTDLFLIKSCLVVHRSGMKSSGSSNERGSIRQEILALV